MAKRHYGLHNDYFRAFREQHLIKKTTTIIQQYFKCVRVYPDNRGPCVDYSKTVAFPFSDLVPRQFSV